MLDINIKAPDFCLPDQDGVMHKLSDYLGKKVILYFYPRDNTSGCTAQALGYSEHADEFADKNTVVLAVSKDSVSSHRKFVDRQNLKITLLSDEEKSVITLYDAWKEKKMYGKISMGVVRTTYLINEEGIIVFANDKVKAKEDAVCMLKW